MNKKTMKEYRIWRAMKARCYAPSQTKGYYKQNNIKVCDRWLHSFDNFYEDMGKIPGNDYSIERINVLGDYEPSNCKWILQRDQSKNRSNSIIVSYNGEQICLKELSRRVHIPYGTVYQRFKQGKEIIA